MPPLTQLVVVQVVVTVPVKLFIDLTLTLNSEAWAQLEGVPEVTLPGELFASATPQSVIPPQCPTPAASVHCTSMTNVGALLVVAMPVTRFVAVQPRLVVADMATVTELPLVVQFAYGTTMANVTLCPAANTTVLGVTVGGAKHAGAVPE